MKRKTGVIQSAIFLTIVVGLAVPGLVIAKKDKGGGKGKKESPNPSVKVSFKDCYPVTDNCDAGMDNYMRIRSDGFGEYVDGEYGASIVFSEASNGALVIHLIGSDSRYINLDFFEGSHPDGNEYLPPPNYYCPYFLDKSGNFQSKTYRGVYAVVQGVQGVPITDETQWTAEDGDYWYNKWCIDEQQYGQNICVNDGSSHWVLRRATFNLETVKGDYEQLRFRMNPRLDAQLGGRYDIHPDLQMTAYVRVEHVQELDEDENLVDVWTIRPEDEYDVGRYHTLYPRVPDLAGVAVFNKKPPRSVEPCALFLMPFYLEARCKKPGCEP